MFAQPYLLGPPAQLDVEIYNSADVNITCQLVLLMAEPAIPPPQVLELIERAQGPGAFQRRGANYNGGGRIG